MHLEIPYHTMIPTMLLSVVFLTLTVSATPIRRNQQPPVCIIGAGPAGLSAGARLEAKGISAVIFDEQKEVGGKCQAWYDEQ
jgi:ribulose 1,5-bisphosphate synthetase/thiazole synthase